MKNNEKEKFLFNIKKVCQDFLAKSISLREFQVLTETYYDTWENEIDEELRSTIKTFIGEVELDRFMYKEEKQVSEIIDKINNLLNYLKR